MALCNIRNSPTQKTLRQLKTQNGRYTLDTVARVSSDSIAKLHGFIVPTVKDGYSQGKYRGRRRQIKT
ncbi:MULTISPECIES: hypothetical protein [Brenneria]|uniref:Uncharacterized protein n=1 Tax=Brenneria nigrifluens DSM 30175 = ATCC 13028 TaxID=1121120 RepID=A0A2U1UQC5_9GAMM|nr:MULTISPECIES: hypothetical protein [Brenneria]PWC23791.1 hypothetical protein DDT54_13045 [Brenneria nigrifluens DSM 30175 = ATCC 13028]QCR03876.1 hypothetical protein EH206_06595 [Brenneria nigrifluens DSM 30175 = ATCC 13028]